MIGSRCVKLPNAERVRIDERKVRDYLLSKTHPIGRFKARVFGAIGFDESNRAAFMAELQRIAASGEISQEVHCCWRTRRARRCDPGSHHLAAGTR